MKNELLIRIYTRPLFDLAVESHQVEAIGAEVKLLAHLFEQVPMLVEYLDSPGVSRADKIGLLGKACAQPWSKYFERFLDLVLRKGRQEILPYAGEAFDQFWDEYRQKLNVIITSAVELTVDQKSALQNKLAARTGKQIALQSQLDPGVLGGIRIQIGHELVDATVANKLANLKQALLQK